MDFLSPFAIAYCAVVLVLSYALRGGTGFGGFAAMPLMALVVPMKTLVPVWTLLTIASSITIIGRDRQHVSITDMMRVAPACVVGIAIGLYFFKTLDARILARSFGVLVIAYASYSLWATTGTVKKTLPAPRMVATISGVVGGIVGTMFGTMASLAFAVYLDAQNVVKERFRATLSAMLLVLSVVRGIGYFAVGEFEVESVVLFAISFPLMLLGVFIGDRVHGNLSQVAFKRIVCGILIASGVPLLIR
jgi:uncharacterized protein